MCAEQEPLECHRTLLVARALENHDINVDLILGYGGIETHRHAMERFLDVTGPPYEGSILFTRRTN